MNSTSRLKKEIVVLIGGVALLYLAALLCGISKTLFATPASAFGGVILLFACRSVVASFFRPAVSVAHEQ